MNKYILLIGLALLAGCSKAKLEAPLCPAIEKGGQAVNEAGLAPVVSDDGRFTYLRLGPGQEVPNVSALRLDDSERHADHTYDKSTNTITVFGIYPTIVLRAGKQVACIRNAQYDPRAPQARNTMVREDGTVW